MINELNNRLIFIILSLLLLPLSVSVIPIIVSTATAQDIPIRQYGFILNKPVPPIQKHIIPGSVSPTILIEGFFDLLCPVSADAYNTYSKLADQYSNTNIEFRVHIHILPFHLNSYTVSEGVYYLASQNTTSNKHSTVLDYIELIFHHQSEFYNPVTENLSQRQIIHQLAKLVDKHSIADIDEFESGLINSGNSIDLIDRNNWKYIVSRGITSTPTFIINGVLTDIDSEWSIKQWNKLIEQLEPVKQSKSDSKSESTNHHHHHSSNNKAHSIELFDTTVAIDPDHIQSNIPPTTNTRSTPVHSIISFPLLLLFVLIGLLSFWIGRESKKFCNNPNQYLPVN